MTRREDSVTFKVVQGGVLFEDAAYVHLPYGSGDRAAQRCVGRAVAAASGSPGLPGSRGRRVAAALFAEALSARGAPPPEDCEIATSPGRGWRGADEWVVDVPRSRVGVRRWDPSSASLRGVEAWAPLSAFAAAADVERGGGAFSPPLAPGHRPAPKLNGARRPRRARR